MNRAFKISIIIASICFIIGIFFFFWASSPTLPEKENTTLSTFNYSQHIKSDSIYSVVTYNIGHLSGFQLETPTKTMVEQNQQKAAALLNTINPDILVFQDIDFDSKRSFNIHQSNEFSKLGYNYIADAVNWNKTHILSPYWPISKQMGKVTAGQSVLSKYSIKEHERVVLENKLDLPFYKKFFYQDRIIQIVKITLGSNTLILLNVHLENSSKAARAIQMKKTLDLFTKYAATNPTILLGDFNSNPNKEEALIKQFFDMPNVGSSTFKNVDHIFYNTNAIEMVNSRVLNEFETVAKHLPIFMQFKLK